MCNFPPPSPLPFLMCSLFPPFSTLLPLKPFVTVPLNLPSFSVVSSHTLFRLPTATDSFSPFFPRLSSPSHSCECTQEETFHSRQVPYKHSLFYTWRGPSPLLLSFLLFTLVIHLSLHFSSFSPSFFPSLLSCPQSVSFVFSSLFPLLCSQKEHPHYGVKLQCRDPVLCMDVGVGVCIRGRDK